MDPVDALVSLGSVAAHADLARLTGRGRLRRALAQGRVVRLRTGMYAVPGAAGAAVAAARLGATVSHLSAALHWGWKVLLPPEQPTLTIPRNRCRVPSEGVLLHWADLGPGEREGRVTSRVRTVVDCARSCSFAAGLSVADSALRDGLERSLLVSAAHASPRTGRARAVRVVEAADARADNPFESALRALCLGAGLDVVPQQWVGGETRVGRVDLLDTRRRLVVEADSFAFHGDRTSFSRDVRRYTALVRAGFVVARFGWEDVVLQPDDALRVLRDLAADLPRLGAVRR
ncbi:MAG: DUF559 domain-containing protein [Nocardioides sp.]